MATTVFSAESEKLPRVVASERDEDVNLMIYFRLVKGGYAASVGEAKQFDARTVLQALYYENFLVDFERAYIELNKTME